MLGRILTANVRDKNFHYHLSCTKAQMQQLCSQERLPIAKHEQLILRLHVTQHNKLHGMTRQTKISYQRTRWKVSVLYHHLAQYFNHSAIYVQKTIKVLGNQHYYYCIRVSTFKSKIFFNNANGLFNTKMRILQKTNVTVKYHQNTPL